MKKEKRINMDLFIKEAVGQIRQGKPLTGDGGIFTPLIKQVLESALEGEMDEHLKTTRTSECNRRNGRTQKNLKSSLGSFEIFTPRDRTGSFEPQTIEKRQTYLPEDIENKILGLYGLGMSYRDIQSHLKEIYGLSVSDGTINSITDRIIPTIREWQSRPLERLYAILWLDAIYFKVREDGKVVTKVVYTVLGLNMTGKKEILGLYIGEHESATFWLQVLTDLKERGIEDILISCIDNLKGFSEAIENIFPKTEVQLCVVHQIRNSIKYISKKHIKEFVCDLREVYKASSIEIAEHKMDMLEAKWGNTYKVVIKSWRNNWNRLTQYFKYPVEIRKLIYTTNAVEGYHRMIRRVTKPKGAFTSETAVIKLVYLATIQINNKWDKIIIHHWKAIINQLFIYFADRIKNNDTVG